VFSRVSVGSARQGGEKLLRNASFDNPYRASPDLNAHTAKRLEASQMLEVREKNQTPQRFSEAEIGSHTPMMQQCAALLFRGIGSHPF
jgi:hypothetical protein